MNNGTEVSVKMGIGANRSMFEAVGKLLAEAGKMGMVKPNLISSYCETKKELSEMLPKYKQAVGKLNALKDKQENSPAYILLDNLRTAMGGLESEIQDAKKAENAVRAESEDQEEYQRKLGAVRRDIKSLSQRRAEAYNRIGDLYSNAEVKEIKAGLITWGRKVNDIDIEMRLREKSVQRMEDSFVRHVPFQVPIDWRKFGVADSYYSQLDKLVDNWKDMKLAILRWIGDQYVETGIQKKLMDFPEFSAFCSIEADVKDFIRSVSKKYKVY